MNRISLSILGVLLIALISGCASNPALNAYITDKESDKALKHIQSGGPINEVDSFGLTALHVAARENDVKVLKALLDHGAAVNVKDTLTRMTPIHFAALHDSGEAIELLVKKGAKIDASDSTGRTALKIAAFSGNKKAAQALLKAGARINKMQNLSSTALINAVSGQHIDMVELLLDSGANVNGTDEHGNTPLIVAAFKGDDKIVKLLLDKKADVALMNDQGQSALIIAAFLENIPVVNLLLNDGADVLAKTKYGRSPVHLAAITGNQVLVNVLLEHGARPAIIDTTEDDLFGTALSNGLYGEWLIKNNKSDDSLAFLTIAENYFTKAETEYTSIKDDLDWKITTTSLKNTLKIIFAAYAAQTQANISARTNGTGVGVGYVQYKVDGTGSLSDTRDHFIKKGEESHQLKEKYTALVKCASTTSPTDLNHCMSAEKESSL